MSLKATEAECAANATAPRVSLADIEAAIAERHNFTAGEAVDGLSFVRGCRQAALAADGFRAS